MKSSDDQAFGEMEWGALTGMGGESKAVSPLCSATAVHIWPLRLLLLGV